MKIYFKIMLFLAISFFIIGYVCPLFISYDDTILVCAGFCLIVGYFPACVFFIKSIIKDIKGEKNEENC